MPEDLSKLILTFKHIPGDLDIYTHELSKTSRVNGTIMFLIKYLDVLSNIYVFTSCREILVINSFLNFSELG